MRIVVTFSIFFCAAISLRAQTSVEIDLEEQMAYLLQNGRPVLASRKHNRGGCRCRHAGSTRRKIYPCTDALFHAVLRSGRNARRIFARLSRVARLCADAGTVCNCVFQFGRRRHPCQRIWPHVSWSLLLGPIAIRFSAASALRPADWSAVGAASTALVAVGSHDRLWL